MKKLNCDECVPVYRAQAPVHCTAQAIARDSAVYQPCTVNRQTQVTVHFFHMSARVCMFVPITSEICLHYSNDDCTSTEANQCAILIVSLTALLMRASFVFLQCCIRELCNSTAQCAGKLHCARYQFLFTVQSRSTQYTALCIVRTQCTSAPKYQCNESALVCW